MIRGIVVLLTLLASILGVGCVGEVMEITETPVQVVVNLSAPIQTLEQDVSKYNFKWDIGSRIGEYHKAPSGYTYAVVSYTIQNDGPSAISTNPFYWGFKADGILYSYDSSSYSDEINHMTVDISPGGTFSNKIVFIVPEDTTEGGLVYRGREMVRDRILEV